MLRYQKFIVDKSLAENLVAEDEKMHKLIYESPQNNGLDN